MRSSYLNPVFRLNKSNNGANERNVSLFTNCL